MSINADPLWFRDSIIYELHVRAFFDSDADGVGDFPGLTQKLDYLEDLGINAVWLLPFYPSPLKDDGYDISDFTGIQSIYGTMQDFKSFVDKAHQRGISVITELVLNHTSDQHPWFQRARRASPQSSQRDFYVWSDTPEKYRDARIIFKDYEGSNWTWDHLAKSYYWHRFYYHQPELNYDNPAVRRAILRTMDFWLRQGVDGLRADAVPYLYEREGTSCENLPETHNFLKDLRRHIDKKYKNRMLLAEANQWPEDAAAYFGDGDEFHMAFHFPLMPRLFMAIRMEDRFPLIDILQQTPPIPETCQWATFLRNHDELTLEMVTDEERDYMYRVYASDPAARLNLGIRRRLAPLLNNDRKKIELMKALLFSLPGTPVIYYGDEIGMGDNFFLGDRNGVRTPMQWSPERNAGFSRSNPQRLYLPPIIEPEYHYEAVNVETQQSNPDSLLWWIKRMIALRKRYKAFSRGSIEFLQPSNRKVLAFLRRYQEETILVVANLSHLAQQAQLDLNAFNGWRPVDLFGGVGFDPIKDGKYYFTLSPHAFYWFSLEQLPQNVLASETASAEETVAVPTLMRNSESLFDWENWFMLESVLRDYVKSQRWFRGKARDIRSVEIKDIIPMRSSSFVSQVILFQIEYTEGISESYVLPLMIAPVDRLNAISSEYPEAVFARLKPRGKSAECLLYDALVDKDYCSFLLQAMGKRRRFKGINGEIASSVTPVFKNIRGPDKTGMEPTPMKVEQSNTSISYGDRLILKLFRKLDDGVNLDLEVGRFLTGNTSFPNISPVAGALEYSLKRRTPSTMGILQAYVPNEGDAWQYTLDSLAGYFQNALAHPTVHMPPVTNRSLLSILKEPPELAKQMIGPYLSSAELLGQRTAELHMALASASDDSDFASEPFTFMYQTSLYQSMRSYTIQTLQSLCEKASDVPEEVAGDVHRVLDMEKAIIDRYRLLQKTRISATRIRCHGDYHLGQVLYTGKDFVIIDFEGEPARSLSERRLKRSPLRDVAGMIRSFHYATHNALLRYSPSLPAEESTLPVLRHWAQFWYIWVSVTFLMSYFNAIKKSGLLPESPDQTKILLDAYLLEKAVYEISYELNNRPGWLRVPLNGILQLFED